ncbi:helix-turn-helix domain-containing protein [Tenacibaculum singaporense]|uniref:helix-turn-helix domain-containing protein n=1 Tax=Tenacibaculum singaporense TaxID=2358479 RepID=UPI000F6705D4|nr:AraC family transcriptional regulator [Tenacibaculum singaporense]RSC94864.1 AraC family transcriptional regulator [Tenacibaculum singaporense]
MEIAIVNDETLYLKNILQLQNKNINCGITTCIYTVNPSYGSGIITSYYFDGLLITIINARFKHDFLFTSNHNLSSLELSVLIEGEKIIRSLDSKNDLILEKNESCLLYSNNEENKAFFYRDKPINEIKISMYDSFIQKHQMQDLLSNNKAFGLKKTENFTQQLTSNMEKVVTEILLNSQKGLLKRLFLESKTLELLHLQLAVRTEKASSSNENILKKIYKVEAILQTNLHEQISIQQLARKVLLNQNVLKNEFKKLFDETIFNYSKKLRMEKAKSLLTHTQKPIYEVADMVGYKNPTHFTAAFKKFEKVTPKEFRKNYSSLLKN